MPKRKKSWSHQATKRQKSWSHKDRNKLLRQLFSKRNTYKSSPSKRASTPQCDRIKAQFNAKYKAYRKTVPYPNYKRPKETAHFTIKNWKDELSRLLREIYRHDQRSTEHIHSSYTGLFDSRRYETSLNQSFAWLLPRLSSKASFLELASFFGVLRCLQLVSKSFRNASLRWIPYAGKHWMPTGIETSLTSKDIVGELVWPHAALLHDRTQRNPQQFALIVSAFNEFWCLFGADRVREKKWRSLELSNPASLFADQLDFLAFFGRPLNSVIAALGFVEAALITYSSVSIFKNKVHNDGRARRVARARMKRNVDRIGWKALDQHIRNLAVGTLMHREAIQILRKKTDKACRPALKRIQKRSDKFTSDAFCALIKKRVDAIQNVAEARQIIGDLERNK